MKYNQKGFTLIELLAVIAILAIIALITTPAIMNVIEDARLKGAEDKAWGTIDAVKQTYALASFDDADSSTSKTATFSDGAASIGGKAVQVSGDAPKSGSVTVNSDGTISASKLVFTGNGKYTCTTNGTGTKMCCAKGELDSQTCS